MEINLKYLLYLADFIWILPAFRQRKTNFFFFFLMFAIDDPISYLVYFFVMPNTYLVAITFTFFAFLSFFKSETLKKNWVYFSLFYFFSAALYFYSSDWKTHAVILITLNILLVSAISHLFILELLKGGFNIFYIVLLSYIFMLIAKLIIYLLIDFKIIANFAYFLHFIEIFIGLFFTIFRADDNRLSIRL